MNDRDFDSEIAQAEADIRELQGLMALDRQRFIEAAGAFFADWYEETARDFVRQQRDVTEAVGSRLGEMKAEVTALCERAPAIAAEAFGKPEQWYDQQGDDPWRHVPSADRLPGAFEDGGRHAVGLLTAILENYGYRAPPSGVWLRWTTRPAGASSFTRRHTPANEAMILHLSSYGSLTAKLLNAERTRKDLEREKAEAQAEDLWDRA